MLAALVPAVLLSLAAPDPQTFARGQLHYKGEEYEPAAIAFARAAGDLSAPDPAARWGLARALTKLGFLASARALFIEIATGQGPYRRKALPWLASLARKLEPDEELLNAISTYGPADLEDAQFEEVRDDLYFMLGRAQYDRGKLEQALASFAQVDRTAVDYTRAQVPLRRGEYAALERQGCRDRVQERAAGPGRSAPGARAQAAASRRAVDPSGGRGCNGASGTAPCAEWSAA